MITSRKILSRRLCLVSATVPCLVIAASLAGCALLGDGVPPGEPPPGGIVAEVRAKKRAFKNKNDAVNYMLASYVTRCPQFAAAPEPPAIFTQFKKAPEGVDDAPDILVGKFARMGLVKVVDSRQKAVYTLLSEFAEFKPASNPEVDDLLAESRNVKRAAHVKWTVSLLDAATGKLLWYDNATFAANPEPTPPNTN